jgi:hypothetical protein
MRPWRPAGALFLAGWVGLVGVITWKARQPAFLTPPYWSTVGVLVGIAAAFLLLWRYDYPYILRLPLVLGIVWLLVLPFLPSAAEMALRRDASRIQIGMTVAEAEAVMAAYSGGTTQFERANGIGDLVYCADDVCDTTAHFNFVDGQIVRVWLDTD